MRDELVLGSSQSTCRRAFMKKQIVGVLGGLLVAGLIATSSTSESQAQTSAKKSPSIDPSKDEMNPQSGCSWGLYECPDDFLDFTYSVPGTQTCQVLCGVDYAKTAAAAACDA